MCEDYDMTSRYDDFSDFSNSIFFILTWKYATRVEINGENISFFEGIYRYNWMKVKYQRILPLKMLLTFWTQKHIAYAYRLILYMAGKHRIRNTSAIAATQIIIVSTAVLKFCTSAVAYRPLAHESGIKN